MKKKYCENIKKSEKKIIVLLFTFFSVLFSHGQIKTYLGASFGATRDHYEFFDSGNRFNLLRPVHTNVFEIFIGQDINKYFRLETGLIKKNYQIDFGFDAFSSLSFSTGFVNSWQIPITLNTKFNLYKEKIFLVTVVGLHFGKTQNVALFDSSFVTTTTDDDSISINLNINGKHSLFFPVISTGIGVEFLLSKKLLLTVSACHLAGFDQIGQIEINYIYNTEPQVSAKVYSTGEFWKFILRLGFPISDFWNAK